MTPRPLALDRISDAALMRLAARDDAAAFRTLIARHERAAHAAARAILGATPAAEDAVQDALLQLWCSAGRFDARRGSLRSYVVLLARSRALDLLRRETVRAAATERATKQLGGTHAHQEDEVERREQARALRDRMIRLPQEQAQVLGLQYLAGRTQSEVASLLDVPLGTVKGRARLGLARLRRDLAPVLAA